MSWIKTPTGRNILRLAGAMGAPLVVAGTVMAIGQPLGRPVRLALMLAAGALAAWLIGLYWRDLDEAAREAQKTAGFWGGTFGMAAGLVLLVLPLDLASRFWPEASPTALLIHGGMVVALCNVAGFTVAWAWWWWARR